jgi:hypothetical protein
VGGGGWGVGTGLLIVRVCVSAMCDPPPRAHVQWSPAAIIILTVGCILAALVVLAGVLPPVAPSTAEDGAAASSTRGSKLTLPLLPTGSRGTGEGGRGRWGRCSALAVAVVQCWNLPLNLSRMLSVNAERSGETAALNGVRVLSMCLVVLGHTVRARRPARLPPLPHCAC